jgi:hypothetical protein
MTSDGGMDVKERSIGIEDKDVGDHGGIPAPI